MKKLLISAVLSTTFFIAFTQECTTQWPYLFSDFSQGTVYFKSGKTDSKFLNIYVLGSNLHFIEGENIVELKSISNIAKVELFKETFLPFEGKFYQILDEDRGGYLALLTTGDLRALQENAGAYGTSSNTSSTKNLSSIELDIGRSILTGNTSHIDLRNNRDMGKKIPLLKKYFFITGGSVIPAKAKEVENILPDAAKQRAFKTFVKANKINWNKPEDLVKVLALF